MGYVIVRDDGLYVVDMKKCSIVSGSSFTRYLQYARVFPTREAAERDLCPGNERVVPTDSILQPHGRYR